MALSKPLREALARELGQCAELMEAELDPRQQAYYFSAAYGSTNRAINMEYDQHIHLIDCVLAVAYQQILARLGAMASGDRTSDLPEKFFPRIIQLLRDLSARVKEDKEAYDIIEEIWKVAYVATGNGYYLWKKGSIEF